MSLLFSPFKLRDLEIKNRIVVSPMCQYSAEDGLANNWHLLHLGSRAVGGAAIVICEATSVSPIGRISTRDLGIWNQQQITAFQPITQFIKEHDSIPCIQIAHAGRKAPMQEPLAPSAIAFSSMYQTPKEMSEVDIKMVLEQFKQAAKNSLAAGFQIAEIHMAHGYLLNEFLSPLSNHRKDQYGGSLENRMRFPLQVADEIRKIWPQKWPVFVRISATDWVEGGWTIQDSILFSIELKKLKIDLIDCSTGGSSPDAVIQAAPGYQVIYSQRIRSEAAVATGAVGIITEAHQAEQILKNEEADLIIIGREFLRDPYWPLHAAQALKHNLKWPVQYERAKR